MPKHVTTWDMLNSRKKETVRNQEPQANDRPRVTVEQLFMRLVWLYMDSLVLFDCHRIGGTFLKVQNVRIQKPFLE